MKQKVFVISLGGSIVVPKNGIDINFLKKFRKFILDKVKLGYEFIIIVGGGTTNREYIEAANKIAQIKAEDNDWTGIAATRLNARLLKSIFGLTAHSEIIIDPTKKVGSKNKIIIGAGYKPGWSSDYDAVLIAKNHNIKTVINLSNIDYVYDKDPKKYKNAKKLERINWSDFRKIVGNKWTPRLNSPFDPIASKLTAKNNMEVVIMNGKKLDNLDKYFKGKKFKGTIIS